MKSYASDNFLEKPPRLRPLLPPPNAGTQKENKLDLRLALKKGPVTGCVVARL
jgi:hypothetical protein